MFSDAHMLLLSQHFNCPSMQVGMFIESIPMQVGISPSGQVTIPLEHIGLPLLELLEELPDDELLELEEEEDELISPLDDDELLELEEELEEEEPVSPLELLELEEELLDEDEEELEVQILFWQVKPLVH